MATDKDKLMRGVRFLFIGFPFIFMGPALLTWAGIPYMRAGNYWWFVISIILMIVAGFFGVKGLMTILSSFFDKKQD